MKKRFKSTGDISLPLALCFGLIFSLIIMLITSLISSTILSVVENPSKILMLVGLIGFVSGGAVSGFSIAKFKGRGGAITSILSSLIFVVVMLIVSAILSRGHVSGAVFMNYLCYLLASSLFAYLGKGKEKRAQRRR